MVTDCNYGNWKYDRIVLDPVSVRTKGNAMNRSVGNVPSLDARTLPRLSRLGLFTTLIACALFGNFGNVGAETPVTHQFNVFVEQGYLSIKVDNVELGHLLEDIARQVKGQLFIGQAAVTSKVSDNFQGLPLTKGIKRLLSGHSYILVEGQTGNQWTLRVLQTGSTGNIVVFNGDMMHTRPTSGTEKGLKDRHQITDATLKLVNDNSQILAKSESKLNAETTGNQRQETDALVTLENLIQTVQEATYPEEHVAAMEDFSNYDQEDVTKALAMAVDNRDPQVRDATLSILEHMAESAPTMLLAEMAATDPDPDIRVRALQSLQDIGSQALADSVEQSIEQSRYEENTLLSEQWSDIEEKKN